MLARSGGLCGSRLEGPGVVGCGAHVTGQFEVQDLFLWGSRQQ